MRIGTLWVLAIFGLVCLIGTVAAQSSANYDLSWNVMGGGGGPMASATYKMDGTVGQIAGLSEGASSTLYAGYWQSMEAVCQRGDLNCDGSIDWSDVVLCAYMSWDLVTPNVAAADFDHSGSVDWNDVVKLAYYQWHLSTEL
jgi:hypothetical protein